MPFTCDQERRYESTGIIRNFYEIPHVIHRYVSVYLWFVLVESKIIGPVFYDGTLTSRRYLEFLRNILKGFFDNLCLADWHLVFFQQDKPLENTWNFNHFFNALFNYCYHWPLHSPNITNHFYLCCLFAKRRSSDIDNKYCTWHRWSYFLKATRNFFKCAWKRIDQEETYSNIYFNSLIPVPTKNK